MTVARLGDENEIRAHVRHHGHIPRKVKFAPENPLYRSFT